MHAMEVVRRAISTIDRTREGIERHGTYAVSRDGRAAAPAQRLVGYARVSPRMRRIRPLARRAFRTRSARPGVFQLSVPHPLQEWGTKQRKNASQSNIRTQPGAPASALPSRSRRLSHFSVRTFYVYGGFIVPDAKPSLTTCLMRVAHQALTMAFVLPVRTHGVVTFRLITWCIGISPAVQARIVRKHTIPSHARGTRRCFTSRHWHRPSRFA